MKVKVAWSAERQKGSLVDAQKYIDKECINYMIEYTPFRTGIMEKSAGLGTVIGSGHIIYNEPYARYQYYGLVMIPVGGKTSKRVFANPKRELRYSTAIHPQAQRLWFEIMKKKHGGAILRGAAAIAGGKASK